ncbi:DUF362 domain-containing protein [candidate division KSB1 bacterium]
MPSMITRRKFLKSSAVAAGSAVVLGNPFANAPLKSQDARSRVVSAAADDMLRGESYNPDTVRRAFEAGLKELTDENSPENAWSSLFSPDDVVGIKMNCVGAPRISSSQASIDQTIEGLKSAGVKENNIILWDHTDGSFRRTGMQVNRSSSGVRIHGTSDVSGVRVPWVEGYDRDVYLSLEDGTLKKYRELMNENFFETATHREIFNSMTWLWILIQQGNEKAQKYSEDIRRSYTDYSTRDLIKGIAEKVADEFNDVVIEDEEKSFFSPIVTKEITKHINIAVLKNNSDSGITWATKNIALGVTTNKIRFHRDFCARSISEIMNFPCIKDKTVLHIGEAAKISTVGVSGAQIANDNRIFFSADPVAIDRIGLDIFEEKRREQMLPSVRHEATHIAACAQMGIGTDDFRKMDIRELRV